MPRLRLNYVLPRITAYCPSIEFLKSKSHVHFLHKPPVIILNSSYELPKFISYESITGVKPGVNMQSQHALSSRQVKSICIASPELSITSRS